MRNKRPRRRSPINISDFTARKQAFMLYDSGFDPVAVASSVEITLATARKYRHDWKKEPRYFNQAYMLLRQTMTRMSPDDKRQVYKALALELGCEPKQIENRMSQPWALRDIATQRWRQWDVKKRDQTGLTARLKGKIDTGVHRSDDVRQVISIALGEIEEPPALSDEKES
jgi:hypothetical protein